MSTILDYVKSEKRPFSEFPFNHIDALVFAEATYFQWEYLLHNIWTREWPYQISESMLFSEMPKSQEMPLFGQYAADTENNLKMIDILRISPRYKDVAISHLCARTNDQEQIQFAAMCFHLPDNICFVAFRGTDGTLVGWKEDFNLSYMPETEGQRRAAEYLNAHFSGQSISIRVGGHSKGGNLAMYAAVCAEKAVRDRIIAVYNNDGPGFLKEFTETEAYRDMVPRFICTVPEKAVIGTLLNSKAFQHVVKSTASGIFQHDGFSWNVLGNRFVEVDRRSDSSIALEMTLHQWLEEQNESNRRTFVNTMFGLLESTGRSTIGEIKGDLPGSLATMWKMLETMNKEQRELVWNMIMQFLAAGGDTILQEMRKLMLNKLANLSLPKIGNEPKPEENA